MTGPREEADTTGRFSESLFINIKGKEKSAGPKAQVASVCRRRLVDQCRLDQSLGPNTSQAQVMW